MKINQEYIDLTPDQFVSRKYELKQNLLVVGIVDPIIVDQDETILDGHLRLAAAQKHELEHQIETLSFNSEAAKRQWIIARALESKQLTKGQSLLLRSDLLELSPAETKRKKAEEVASFFPAMDLEDLVKWLALGASYGGAVARCAPSVRAHIWDGGRLSRPKLARLAKLSADEQQKQLLP